MSLDLDLVCFLSLLEKVAVNFRGWAVLVPQLHQEQNLHMSSFGLPGLSDPTGCLSLPFLGVIFTGTELLPSNTHCHLLPDA